MALTQAQLDMRLSGIGASEIGAVCGLSPYRGPHDVRNVKLGISSFTGNEHTERGTYLEPAIIEWAKNRWGWVVQTSDVTLRHPKYPIVLATPDGIVTGPDLDGAHLLEVKCPAGPSSRLWGPEETDEVPAEYRAQVTWGMAVTGTKHAFVVALLNGRLVRYHVEYDHAFFKALLGRALAFWRLYIEGDEVPPLDGGEGAKEWLDKMFPHANEETLPCDEESEGKVKALLNATAFAKGAEAARKLRAQELKLHMGTASRLESELAHVTYRNTKKGDRRLSVLEKAER